MTLRMPPLVGLLMLAESLAATELQGILQWAKRTELATLVSGVVSEVRVQPGQQVRAGEQLVLLDDREFRARIVATRATVDRASALFAEAKREADRADELYERTVLSDHDLQLAKIALQDALSDLQTAKAELTQAHLDLERSRVVAPYDAVVLRVDASPGMVVISDLQSQALLAVAGRRRLTARALGTIGQLAGVQPGAAVRVGVRDKWLDATVAHVGLEPQPGTTGEARYPLSVALEAPEALRLFVGEPVVIRLQAAP